MGQIQGLLMRENQQGLLMNWRGTQGQESRKPSANSFPEPGPRAWPEKSPLGQIPLLVPCPLSRLGKPPHPVTSASTPALPLEPWEVRVPGPFLWGGTLPTQPPLFLGKCVLWAPAKQAHPKSVKIKQS